MVRGMNSSRMDLGPTAVRNFSKAVATASQTEPELGSWDALLREAGLPPEGFRRKTEQSRPLIIRVIRSVAASGHGLNFRHVRYNVEGGGRLVQNARRLFGSWDTALRAAGFNPAEIRKALPKVRPADVLETIADDALAGKSINQTEFRRRHTGRYEAALRIFRSWNNALWAYGIEPRTVAKRPTIVRYTTMKPFSQLTAEEIAREVRARYRNGASVKGNDNSVLRRRAVWLGVGWDRILEMALPGGLGRFERRVPKGQRIPLPGYLVAQAAITNPGERNYEAVRARLDGLATAIEGERVASREHNATNAERWGAVKRRQMTFWVDNLISFRERVMQMRTEGKTEEAEKMAERLVIFTAFVRKLRNLADVI
jgi:hypothetical protein